MFSWRPRLSLRPQKIQVSDKDFTSFTRFDYVVDVSVLGSDVWVREFLPVVFYQLGSFCFFVLCACNFLSEDYVDGAFWSHYSDLGCGPSDIRIYSDVLTA